MVSPPCTAFSIANQGEVDRQTLESVIRMIRFSIELCELQHKSGRHFIFEQPQSSRAWSLNEVVKMTYHEGVEKTTFHQCMYGLMARDDQGSAPAYKPTSGLTNHPALVEVLQKRCSGGHRHAQFIWNKRVYSIGPISTGAMHSSGEGNPDYQEESRRARLSSGSNLEGESSSV